MKTNEYYRKLKFNEYVYRYFELENKDCTYTEHVESALADMKKYEGKFFSQHDIKDTIKKLELLREFEANDNEVYTDNQLYRQENKLVSASVPLDEYQEIKNWCWNNNINMARLVREAIQEKTGIVLCGIGVN